MNEEARQIIAEECLIAADVDRALLTQEKNPFKERASFVLQTAPQIIRAANLGARVGFVTGNSMHKICSRVLQFLVEQLCNASFDRLLGDSIFRVLGVRCQRAVKTSHQWANQNQPL